MANKKNKLKKQDVLVAVGDEYYHIQTPAGQEHPAAALALCSSAIKLSETDPLLSLERFNEALKMDKNFFRLIIAEVFCIKNSTEMQTL